MRRTLAAILAALAVPTTAHADTGCHTHACVARVKAKHERWDAHWCRRHRACAARVARRRMIEPYRAWLASTRMCESHGNYRTNTGNGFYGAYQFTLSSWRVVGGWGMPNMASPAEQDYRAVLLLRRSGAGNWPVCGH